MSAVLSDEQPQLRPMRGADVRGMLRVENQVYEFPWTEVIFQDCLRAGYVCRVFATDDAVVGYGIMSVGAGECHLLNLTIHPEYQRRGLGHQLIESLLEFARQHKVRMAFLEARQSNVDACRLYLELGFNEIGVRKNYYPARNGREHAVILAKML